MSGRGRGRGGSGGGGRGQGRGQGRGGRGQGRGGAQPSPYHAQGRGGGQQPQPSPVPSQGRGGGGRGNVGSSGPSGYRGPDPSDSASSSTALPPTRELQNLSTGSPAPAPGRAVAPGPLQLQPAMQPHKPGQTQSPQQQVEQAPPPLEAVPSVPSSSKSHRTPDRPGYGTAGRKCVIRANHFLVDIGDKDPYQYDVTITPEVTSKTKCRHIMKVFSELYKQSHLGMRRLAYDGKKSAFAAGPLPFESKEFVVSVPETDGRQREFKVTIKFAARKDLHHLQEFLSGRQLDNPQETIQALDVVLRESASKDREIVGRSLYSPAFGKGSLGNGIEFWKGFYQSLRPTQMGLSLNIDMSARAFYEPKLVSDFVGEFLRKDLSRPLSDQDRVKVKKVLRGLKVEVRHRGYVRRYKVQGLSTQPTNQLSFPVDATGVTISVVQYFREKYNIVLRLAFLPAIQAGSDAKPTYLPMEICRLVEGQRYSKKLNEYQVSALLKATCQRPHERESNITSMVRSNNYSDDPLVKEDFGMRVREQLVSIDARVLPPPALKYHESGRSSQVNPSVGQWNMIDLKMVNGGKVNFWACVNFSRHREDAVNHFCNELISMCQDKGIVFNPQPLIRICSAGPQNIEKALVDVHSRCASQIARVAPGQQLQLLFVILPDASGSYGKIKRVCETELGIVSQCCQPKHVMRISKQYLENVALKINVKVGGRNTVLLQALSKNLPMVSQCPTIIFGADVTHPQPGEDSSPSIAAVVASMDWPEITKYRGLVSAQLHRKEIIEDLYTTHTDPQRGVVHGGLIREHLIAFKKATGLKPYRIIFYRDGVSEGQFNQVLLEEMDKIRKACCSLEDGYLPPVTFIVVQKRHHTRLFPAKHGDRATTDRSGNILPGTVVDTKICHPTEFDFYLCSHAGIQGTSRPTHYHVLYDENKFSADGLQMLTNSLCYTYARCTKSVSIVPPAYYAHLAAFRARYYMESDFSESESAQGARATRERTADVRPLPVIRDNVKDVMFYC